jgi:alkaline phosphatase
MATGTVSTARLTHATPAGNYAHSASREWESNEDLTEEAVANGCTDIAAQLVTFSFGDGVDVAFGGGRREFIPETLADPEYADRTGDRTDGQNLTEVWLSRDNAAYVWNKEQFDALDVAAGQKVLGLFEPSHMQYNADRNAVAEPSLTEMTLKAIDLLSGNENGYVLQVEAGRVDHALHEGNAYRALTDNIEFANAVQATLDKVSLEDTLIIVTSDHGHAMSFSGYPKRGNPILGLVVDVEEPTDVPYLADDGKPYTSLGFANGPGSIFITEDGYVARLSDRDDLTDVDTEDPDYLQASLVPLESETHGGTDVAAYAVGPRSYLLRGVVEQNYLFHVIDHALDLTNRAVE